MDGEFTHKDRILVGIHKTATFLLITYSSVVTKESVRQAFLIDGMNDLDICA